MHRIEQYLKKIFVGIAYPKPSSKKKLQSYASHDTQAGCIPLQYLSIILKIIPTCLNMDFYHDKEPFIRASPPPTTHQ